MNENLSGDVSMRIKKMLVSVLSQRFNPNLQVQTTSKKLETLLASYKMKKSTVDELVARVNSHPLWSSFNADVLALVLKYTSDNGDQTIFSEYDIDEFIEYYYKGKDTKDNVKATFLIYYNSYVKG